MQKKTPDYDNVFKTMKSKHKRLFPYIPFYIARYEKEIAYGDNIENAVRDLKYFRDEMFRLNEAGELSENEIIDLKGFINTIVTHITNGNKFENKFSNLADARRNASHSAKNEERLVNVMGGTVIETESERLLREGMSQGMSEGIRQGIREGIKRRISQGIRQGKAQLLIEMGKEEGLDDAALLKRMQDKIGLSLEQATAYLKQYGSMVSGKE